MSSNQTFRLEFIDLIETWKKVKDDEGYPLTEGELLSTLIDWMSRMEHNGLVDDLWQEQVHNSDPAVLAKWIEAGGLIDQQARDSIVLALRGEIKPAHRSGQDKHRDYLVYLEVHDIERQQEKRNHSAAIREYLNRRGGGLPGGVDEPRIKAQYKRGSQLYCPSSKHLGRLSL